MENIISILNTNPVQQAYEKRNRLYKFYLNDLTYRALSKILNRKDIDKITLGSVKVFSAYKDTVELAVNAKFKDIKNKVNAIDENGIFTLEPIDPSLVETNMDLLENVYGDVKNNSLLNVTPVKKETSELVADIGFNLLNLVKNNIGDYAKEFIANVKSITSNTNEEVDDNIDVRFLEVNTINEVIIEDGVIHKSYSGNYEYNFDVNYDSLDLIKAVVDTNYDNIDLNSFDMEIDTEFKNYLEELEDAHIEEFKDTVNSFIDKNLSVKAFVNQIANYQIPGLRDLQVLTYLWVASINKYISTKNNEYLEIAGYLEQIMYNTVRKIENLKTNKTLAVFTHKENKYYIYIVLKEYLKALEKQKDIINSIKGYVINSKNDIKIIITIKDLEDAGYIELKNSYNKYLANLNYKRIISRVIELRDAYIYGFVKSSDKLLNLIDKDYDKLDEIKKAVELYVSELKVDELIDVDNTVYNIVKNVLFKDIISTVESFINLGEKRFPDNEDDAMVFAIIMTLTEVAFSLFRIKVLDRVD